MKMAEELLAAAREECEKLKKQAVATSQIADEAREDYRRAAEVVATLERYKLKD